MHIDEEPSKGQTILIFQPLVDLTDECLLDDSAKYIVVSQMVATYFSARLKAILKVLGVNA